jgi:hypothetical protein
MLYTLIKQAFLANQRACVRLYLCYNQVYKTEFFNQIKEGGLEFDQCLSTMEMLDRVKSLQRILRQKMPTTRRGNNAHVYSLHQMYIYCIPSLYIGKRSIVIGFLIPWNSIAYGSMAFRCCIHKLGSGFLNGSAILCLSSSKTYRHYTLRSQTNYLRIDLRLYKIK